MKTLLHSLGTALVALAIILIFSGMAHAYTCDEMMELDWGSYNLQEVQEILTEDMTQDSQMIDEQKQECLIKDMKNYWQDFDAVSSGIKYEALTAISALETGWFTSDYCVYYNNVGGMMKANSKPMEYPSKNAGIHALATLLTQEYLSESGAYYEGTTILDVSKHYNPSKSWIQLYTKVRIDMKHRADKVQVEVTEQEENMSETSKLITDEQEQVLQQARDTYGAKNQLVIAAEECDELACALLKYIRYDESANGLEATRQAVLEERADVEVILNHIDSIYGFTEEEIMTQIRYKIRRLSEWMRKSDSLEFTTVLREVKSPCEDCFVADHFETDNEKCKTCKDGVWGND